MTLSIFNLDFVTKFTQFKQEFKEIDGLYQIVKT